MYSKTFLPLSYINISVWNVDGGNQKRIFVLEEILLSSVSLNLKLISLTKTKNQTWDKKKKLGEFTRKLMFSTNYSWASLCNLHIPSFFSQHDEESQSIVDIITLNSFVRPVCIGPR